MEKIVNEGSPLEEERKENIDENLEMKKENIEENNEENISQDASCPQEDIEENDDDNEILFNLKEENSRLNSELEALKDRLLRLNAEYDNYRKRTSKEKEGIYDDACEDILKNILPVLDNLERAVSAEGDVDDLKKGIEMTLRQFYDALEKLQVEEISTEGEFDPNWHNAVMHMEDDNYGTNQVAEVFQKGYKRGDKVIRYSMVKVAN